MDKKDITSLSEFIDKEVGKKGTRKRDKFESGYQAFKQEVISLQVRQQKN